MAFIEILNVKKYFKSSKALDGVSLKLEKAQQYVLQGPSGSGKSTLLYLLGGLDSPDLGDIYVDGKNIHLFNDEKLAQYRNLDVGFVFQFHFLLSSMNCMENILLPAHIGGIYNKKLKSEVFFYAEKLEMQDALLKFPHELSGGEQQRINILRAILLRPKILLCDEPTGNLDSAHSEKVISLLRALALKIESTLILVTHDDHIAENFENKLALKDGKLTKAF